jgi:hypothetical protein
MILGFKMHFPWGEETHFWQKIIASCPIDPNNPQASPANMYLCLNPKLHSIREGQRWKVGDTIHMATGVRTSSYWQFNKDIPDLQKVKAIQRIDIIIRNDSVRMIFVDRKLKYLYSKKDQAEIDGSWFLEFAYNDGFDNKEQFWKWFTKTIRNGQIIHWTDHKY